jgi:hypothetical protein
MNKITELLQFKEVETIGSYADEKINKFASDVDFQEIIFTKKSYKNILKEFQKMFSDAEKMKGVYILDFKCGVFRGNLPIRWNKETIQKGYQMIDHIKINFIDCLQQTSMIKIDLIALINHVFVEFSNNYYFNFPSGLSTRPQSSNTLDDLFVMDYQKFIQKELYFKALKRLYRVFKLRDDTKNMNTLIKLFNGEIGLFNFQINSLNIIHDVIGNNFKEVELKDVLYNLKIVEKNLPNLYKKDVDKIIQLNDLNLIKDNIPDLIDKLNKTSNKKVLPIIKKNFKNISLNKI